jgi:tetratricopeptide (TPR) repeat protein
MYLNRGSLDAAHRLFRDQYGVVLNDNSFDIPSDHYHLCISFGCLALCYLETWELDKAILFSEKAKNVCQGRKVLKNLQFIDIPLSIMLRLLLDNSDKEASQELQKEAGHTYSDDIDLQSWDLVYRSLYLSRAFLSINELDQSLFWSNQAVRHGETLSLKQGKAKAFSIFQEIYRLQGNYSQSLKYADLAIEQQLKLAAKSDLAESYLFQALTYRDMREQTLANEAYQKSYKLYEQIQAPKQIERIARAFKN